jgi:hypothetical protein
MKSLLDKLFLNKVRHTLNKFVRRAIENDKNISRIQGLEQQLKTHHELIYELLPDVFPMDTKIDKVITEFCQRHHLPSDFNRAVSKHDLMFHAELVHSSNGLSYAYKQYFKGGFYGLELVQKICSHHFGSMEQVNTCLDFASGYGRISRMFSSLFESSNIWISDIRSEGVEFQKQHFGYNGFTSAYKPEEVNFPTHFDVIFVGSLFTHLDEHLFESWLKVLLDQVTPKGVLIFTTHRSGNSNSNFTYRTSSEEQRFSFVKDTIEDTNVYGTTVLSDTNVREIIKKVNPQYTDEYIRHYPNSFGNIQDTYVVGHEPLSLPKDLSFTDYYALS